MCPKCISVLCDYMEGVVSRDEAERLQREHMDDETYRLFANGFTAEHTNA